MKELLIFFTNSFYTFLCYVNNSNLNSFFYINVKKEVKKIEIKYKESIFLFNSIFKFDSRILIINHNCMV